MVKPPQQTFWDRLEEASRDIGLPFGLSDIGRELDMWPSAIKKWRDGDGLPAQKTQVVLAKNRGVNVEWLLTGRGPKLSEDAMDAATRELLSVWTKLDNDAQQRILAAARYEKRAREPSDNAPPPPAPTPLRPGRR